MMLSVLDVEGAVRKVKGGWTATGAEWSYDAERHARVAEQRAAEQAAMREYMTTTGCRMQLLRRVLDDPDAGPCGRCDRCTGEAPGSGVTEGALAGAQEALGRPGVVLDPRAMWPSGMAATRGRAQRPDRARGQGRARPRGGPAVRPRLGQPAASAARPDPPGRPGARRTCSPRWSRCWRRGAGSSARPGSWRCRAAGARCCWARWRPGWPRWGGSPCSAPSPAPGSRPRAAGSNAAQRLSAVHGSFAVPAELADGLAALAGAPVLLVDDRYDTGWTVTEATRLLRDAGAGPGAAAGARRRRLSRPRRGATGAVARLARRRCPGRARPTAWAGAGTRVTAPCETVLTPKGCRCATPSCGVRRSSSRTAGAGAPPGTPSR